MQFEKTFSEPPLQPNARPQLARPQRLLVAVTQLQATRVPALRALGPVALQRGAVGKLREAAVQAAANEPRQPAHGRGIRFPRPPPGLAARWAPAGGAEHLQAVPSLLLQREPRSCGTFGLLFIGSSFLQLFCWFICFFLSFIEK